MSVNPISGPVDLGLIHDFDIPSTLGISYLGVTIAAMYISLRLNVFYTDSCVHCLDYTDSSAARLSSMPGRRDLGPILGF